MKIQRTTSEENETNIELYNELLYQHSPITIFGQSSTIPTSCSRTAAKFGCSYEASIDTCRLSPFPCQAERSTASGPGGEQSLFSRFGNVCRQFISLKVNASKCLLSFETVLQICTLHLSFNCGKSGKIENSKLCYACQ